MVVIPMAILIQYLSLRVARVVTIDVLDHRKRDKFSKVVSALNLEAEVPASAAW
jgi:hypothetical protein